jgi:hypothetical protein
MPLKVYVFSVGKDILGLEIGKTVVSEISWDKLIPHGTPEFWALRAVSRWHVHWHKIMGLRARGVKFNFDETWQNCRVQIEKTLARVNQRCGVPICSKEIKGNGHNHPVIPGIPFIICDECHSMAKTHKATYKNGLFTWVPRQEV